MFPTRGAGLALLILRTVVAITVFIDTYKGQPTEPSLLLICLVAMVEVSLLLGLMTPYCAAASCLIELVVLYCSKDPDGLRLGTGALTAATIALLGPGAYSLDARIFGRRLIKVSPPRKPQ